MHKLRLYGLLFLILLASLKFLYVPLKQNYNDKLFSISNYESMKKNLIQLNSKKNPTVNDNNSYRVVYKYVNFFSSKPLNWQMKVIEIFKNYCEKKNIEITNFEIMEIYRDKLFSEPSVRLRFKTDNTAFFGMLENLGKDLSPVFIRQLKIFQSGDKLNIELVISTFIYGVN